MSVIVWLATDPKSGNIWLRLHVAAMSRVPAGGTEMGGLI